MPQPVRPDGVTSFSRLQAAMDEGRTGKLVFFTFDLLFLNGESTTNLPLFERKARLQALFRLRCPAFDTASTSSGTARGFANTSAK